MDDHPLFTLGIILEAINVSHITCRGENHELKRINRCDGGVIAVGDSPQCDGTGVRQPVGAKANR